MNYSRDPPPPYETAATTPSAPYPTIGYAVGPYSDSTGYQGEPSNEAPKTNRDGPFTNLQYSDKYVRHAFIRKVIFHLFIESRFFLGLFNSNSPIISDFSLHLHLLVFISCKKMGCKEFMVLLFILCNLSVHLYRVGLLPSVRRRYPGNVIALSVFTLAFSYMTGTITSYYDTQSVLIAVAITACLCIAISIFAMQTRIDITKCTSLIFVLSIVVMLTGIACIIVYAVSGPNRILQVVYGGLGALLFGVVRLVFLKCLFCFLIKVNKKH
ncbi:unnamed protein product [Heterobilharzia americana]|nr:unnamed protein product [Heterobilharzia americana]